MTETATVCLLSSGRTQGAEGEENTMMQKLAIGAERTLDAAAAKQAALRYILDAWEEAIYDGLDSDCIATAAIFAAFSDMIATYGEEPVARMAERLAERIRQGEFTVGKTTQ